MKKYIFLTIATVLLGLTSCSEDYMDKANKNNANPASEIVPANFQITDAILSTAYNTVSGAYAFYCSTLTEQEFATGDNQMKNAELRNSNELSANSSFDDPWTSTYSTLYNLKQIMNKVENNTAGSGKMRDVLGAAQVLWVINFGVLTDLHGDISYAEAFQGNNNWTPSVDPQKDIYAALINMCDTAIATLEGAQSLDYMEDNDIAFHGDMEQWLATAYAVKARYLIHQTCVNPNAAQLAKEAAEKAIELGFEGFQLDCFNGNGYDNPWSAYVWSVGYTAPSSTMTNLMGEDDPRLYFYTYGEDPEDVAADPGDEEMAMKSETWDYPAIYDLGSQPVNILSAHELYFILAEAQIRCGEDGTDAFQTAVSLSINEQAKYAEDMGMDFDEGYEDYAESLGKATLQKVFEQKYIASYIDEQIETYNDLRRCKGMGTEYIELTNPKNTQGGLNRWPYLLPYGQSSVTNNPKLSKLVGNGMYIFDKQCWLYTAK